MRTFILLTLAVALSGCGLLRDTGAKDSDAVEHEADPPFAALPAPLASASGLPTLYRYRFSSNPFHRDAIEYYYWTASPEWGPTEVTEREAEKFTASELQSIREYPYDFDRVSRNAPLTVIYVDHGRCYFASVKVKQGAIDSTRSYDFDAAKTPVHAFSPTRDEERLTTCPRPNALPLAPEERG
jgi:hypothetical protein